MAGGKARQVRFSGLFSPGKFLVVERSPLEFDLHPLNHVSARSDEIRVGVTLELFCSAFPTVGIDAFD